MRVTRLLFLVAMTVSLIMIFSASSSAITIDGDFSDWTGAVVFDIPQEQIDAAESVYGKVERLSVAHDDVFIYFRVEFVEGRPFDLSQPKGWPVGYWDNMRYIQLDVDGDAVTDYHTNQIKAGNLGMNSTYVVKVEDEKKSTYLWYEGEKHWLGEVGPKGHYSPDYKQIEIRVPKEQLNIEDQVIGVRVLMSQRGGPKGINEWTGEAYPSPTTYFLYDMSAGAKIEAGEQTGLPSVTMVRTDAAPTIDGSLDDPQWQDKPILGDFIANRASAPVQAATNIRITYDQNNLYLGIQADEPQMAMLKTEAVVAEAKRVWQDDVIELFIDYHNDKRTFYHMGITAIGMLAGQIGIASGEASLASIDVEPSANVAWSHSDTGWIVEAAIPFANLAVTPVPGDTWSFNICRARPVAREYSSWAGVQGRFAQPATFGTMHFPSDAGIVVESRGMAARRGNADEANTFSGTYTPAVDTPVSVSIVTRAGSKQTGAVERTFDATAGKLLQFAVPYVVAGLDGEMVELRVEAGGAVIYENSIPVIKTDFPKAWVTPDPLYEELMGDSGPGMAAEGVIYWSHDIVNYNFGPFCLKYAQPYELEFYYRNAAERKLHFLDNGTMVERNNFNAPAYLQKFGGKTIYMGNRRAHAEGTPTEGAFGYHVDPANQEVYLQEMHDYITNYHDYLWAINTGDEVQDSDMMRGLRILYGEEGYPFMAQVDAEVKAEFGYGQWGIPTSLNDRNAFRWIAYRRWYNDRFAKFQKRIFDLVREIAPDLKIIGPDPVAQVQPFDYAAYGKYCDIVTHQTYPRGPQEQDAAWITKTLRDLCGVATMPCVHVENYANSFRPDEVREIMSQVYRAGGEGFHLYMPDTAGNQRGTHDMVIDRHGAWARWETVMGTLDNSRTINRPSLPKSSAAILYSDDAYSAEFLGGSQGSDPYRWMFNLLGPGIRGWFTIISDSQIGRDEIDPASYDVIYVPMATYMRREIVEVLVEYVENGGRLVVTQPSAFSWHLDGTAMADVRAELFFPNGEAEMHTSASVPDGCGVLSLAAQMPVIGSAATLQCGDGALPILIYEDGSVAAAAKQVGRGMVYSFGFDPMMQNALSSEAWQLFWKAFHQAMGQNVDLDIWRFTFPAVPAAEIAPPVGRCLTNNYVIWDTNEMIPTANLPADGTYTYSLAPDYAADEGGVENIPFAKGDLTDRRDCMKFDNGTFAEELKRSAVGWKTTEAVTITVDLGTEYELDRIWAIYGNYVPAVTVEAQIEGEWQEIGTGEGRPLADAGDYPAVTMQLDKSAPSVRHLRMTFAAREEGQILLIPEMEIWARN